MQHSFTSICFILLVTATVLIMAARSNIDTPEAEDPESEGTLTPESEGPEADGTLAAEKINAVVRKGSGGGGHGGGGRGSGGRGSGGRSGGRNRGGGAVIVIGGTGTNSGRKSGKCKSKTNSCPAKDKTTNIKFVWEFVVRILAVQHNIQLIANPGPNQLMLYDHTVPKTNSLQHLNGQSDIMEMKFDPSEKVHLYVDQKEVTDDFCEYDCDAKICTCNVAFKYEENEMQTSDAHRTVQMPYHIKFAADAVYRFVKWLNPYE